MRREVRRKDRRAMVKEGWKEWDRRVRCIAGGKKRWREDERKKRKG